MDINDFLGFEAQLKRSRCAVCDMPELAEELRTYAAAREAGTTDVSVLRLHTSYVLPKYGRPLTADTIRAHFRRCVGVDL